VRSLDAEVVLAIAKAVCAASGLLH